MGICSAPEAFQQFMISILGQLSFVLIYIDDVLIFSDNVEKHVQHLEQVYTIFRMKNVHLKLSKCEFLKNEIKFLRFILGPEGLTANPAKVQAIQKIAYPRTKRQVR